MKNIMKLGLIALLAISMVVSMVSCAPSLDDIKDALKEWEDEGGDYGYEKYDKDDRKEMLEDLEDMDLDVDFKGDVEQIYEVYGEADGDDATMWIFAFEKLADAKTFAKNDLDDIDNEWLSEYIEEYDVVLVRKGKIVFFGPQDMIDEFLDLL